MEKHNILEVGSRYKIFYSDGRIRTFFVEGGPTIQVSFENDDTEDGYTDITTAIKGFESIVKIS